MSFTAKTPSRQGEARRALEHAHADLTLRKNPWHAEPQPLPLPMDEALLAAQNARTMSLAARLLVEDLSVPASWELLDTLAAVEALGAAICRRIADGVKEGGR